MTIGVRGAWRRGRADEGVKVSIIEHEVIDKINILQATMLGMSSAVKQLEEPPDFVLVDGNRSVSQQSARCGETSWWWLKEEEESRKQEGRRRRRIKRIMMVCYRCPSDLSAPSQAIVKGDSKVQSLGTHLCCLTSPPSAWRLLLHLSSPR